jgi:hypothetical protein
MADTKISALAAATTALGADEFPVNEAGTSKKVTLTQAQTLFQLSNYSVASQAPTAATRTYITGSAIAIPVGKLRIGTILRWKFNMTKTSAGGTATSIFDIAFGTAGTTADTARVSFTKPIGTAAADEGWVDIICTIRGPLSASGIAVGQFILVHNLAATGHAAIPVVVLNTISSAFDVTTPTYVGICITTGTGDAVTIQEVQAEAINL